MQLGQDNKAAIQTAENPGQHASKVKHAMADLHWVQEQIEFETVALVSVKGCGMIADPMTKALAYDATSNCNGFASHVQVLRGQKMPTMAKPSKRKVSENGNGEVDEWATHKNPEPHQGVMYQKLREPRVRMVLRKALTRTREVAKSRNH